MARKRRLNTKFLMLVAIPVFLLGGLFAAYKILPKVFPQVRWIVKGTPTQRAANAKVLFDQGKFQEAAEEYKQAMVLKGTYEAPMYTVLGDCYSHLVLADAENLKRSKGYWDLALTVDPNHLPALKRIMELLVDDAELNPGQRSAMQWDEVQKVAAKVVAVDSNDREAKLLVQRSIIQRWMAGVETSPQRIDDAIGALTELANQEPFDAEPLSHVLNAKMTRGIERLKAQDRKSADEIFADVVKTIDDALAAHPDNAHLHYRASQALFSLGFNERVSGQQPKYLDRVRAELGKTVELLKSDDPKYVEIKRTVGKQLEILGDGAAALKVYRSLHEDRPKDITATVALAELLMRDPATRDEAILLLESAPEPDPMTIAGMKAVLARRFQLTALVDLANGKLDMLPTIADQQKQKATLKEIEDTFAKILAYPGVAESPLGLQTRGRIELARGENLQAKQTLDRALDLMPAASNMAELEQRYRLMYTLAGACLLTEQTGQAKKLLTKIVAANGSFSQARIMLAQLLLREGDKEGALKELDELARLMPDSIMVTRLTMLALDKEKDKGRIDELYGKLKETNPQEMVSKAEMAVVAGKDDDATRLFEAAHAAMPDNMDILVALTQQYLKVGNKPRAMQLVDAALAKSPDQPRLKMLQALVNGTELGPVRRGIIENISDPFLRELGLYDLAMQGGNRQEALQHMAAAAKLKPDDGRVLDLQFQEALEKQDWAGASAYVEKLAARNHDSANGALYRVRLALARGDTDQAASLATQLTRDMSGFAQSWVVLGQVHRAQHNPDDAIQNFTAALQLQANNLDAIRGMIAASYDLNQPTQAQHYIEIGLQMYPRNGTLREVQLQHEMRFGDPEKVIAPREAQLKEAIDSKDPDEPLRWRSLGNTYLAVARGKDKPDDAASFFLKAQETFGQAVQKWPDEIAFVQLYSEAATGAKHFAEAEKAIRDLGQRPNWQGKPEPTLLLSDYYRRIDKPADQEAVLRDFLKTSPQNPSVQSQLASVLANQKKFDDALAVLNPNSDDPTIRRQRIELQIVSGHMAEAEKEVQNALASTSNPSPVLLNRQAYLYMQTNRPTEALQVLGKVLEANPNNIEALYFRGSIYVAARRNLEQAIRDLRMVRDAQQNQLSTRMLLSDAYYYSGDNEAAIREMEDATRQFPTDKPARLRLLDYYVKAKPPRWSLAEKALRDARSLPQLANDPDMLHAEALMWLERGDGPKATDLIVQAGKADPTNLNIFRTYCRVLQETKKYAQLLTLTKASVDAKSAGWWVYEFRGRAQRGLSESTLAMDEFAKGMEVALSAGDNDGALQIVNTIATEISIPAAKQRIFGRAATENRWRLMLIYLLQKENDFVGAISWADRVINDPNATPEEVAQARTTAATDYLRLEPPDPGKAVELYKKLLERDPYDVSSLNNLACAMILPKSGFTAADALVYSQRAMAQVEQQPTAAPYLPYIYDTHGYVLVLTGKVDEGIGLLQRAIDRQPIPEACYHLGEAYLALPTPQYADAQTALEQAIKVLSAATLDNKPVDAELKGKIDKALERARQSAAPG